MILFIWSDGGCVVMARRKHGGFFFFFAMATDARRWLAGACGGGETGWIDETAAGPTQL